MVSQTVQNAILFAVISTFQTCHSRLNFFLFLCLFLPLQNIVIQSLEWIYLGMAQEKKIGKGFESCDGT